MGIRVQSANGSSMALDIGKLTSGQIRLRIVESDDQNDYYTEIYVDPVELTQAIEIVNAAPPARGLIRMTQAKIAAALERKQEK